MAFLLSQTRQGNRTLIVGVQPTDPESDPIPVKITDAVTASLIRWGIIREPIWVDGAENTAPGATTALVTQTVTLGKTGRVFGVHIKADEGNSFQLRSGAAVIKSWAIGAQGSIDVIVSSPLLDNVAAGTAITIVNVTGGTAGKVYQASLLYDEA